MKLMTAYLAAVLSMGVMGTAKADEVPAPAPTATEACATACNKTDGGLPFALDFTVDGEYFAFDSEITAITPTVKLGFGESLALSASLPVYNEGDETDFSDINFGVHYTLFSGKCSFLGDSCTSLGVKAGVGVPLDGYFSSEEATYTVGGDFGVKFDSFKFTQDFSYLFANGSVYSPDFGGFVGEDIISADSVLSYSLAESFSVGAKFSQNYCDNSQVLTLGPVADLAIAKGVDLNFGVLFPVSQEDMPYGENDFTVSAGLGFEF